MWKLITDCLRLTPNPEQLEETKSIEISEKRVIAVIEKDKFKPDGTRLYDWEEIIKHVDDEDCWLVYKGFVIDVSQYIEEHPGGENIIYKYAGRDCTEAFVRQKHSSYARTLLDRLKIGEVDPEAPIKYPNDKDSADKEGDSDEKEEEEEEEEEEKTYS